MRGYVTKPNFWLILLISAGFSVSDHAQTTKPSAEPGLTAPLRPTASPGSLSPTTSTAAPINGVTFRDLKLNWNYVPRPPEALWQVDAQLSGALTGQSANLSIEFVLLLQNNGRQDVEILDPLDFFSLQFVASSGWPIEMPRRVPWFLQNTGRVKGAAPDAKRNAPYSAPVQFCEIARVNGSSAQKEETITIPSGTWIRIVFQSEPVVMEKVSEALRSETEEGAKQFKARAMMSLVAAPPQQGVGSRLVESDWLFFSL
jgi:hypothetical protein